MRNSILVPILIAALMPTIAQAQETPAAPAAAPAKPERKLCRSEAVTGSMLGGKRVCHTTAEWKAIDKAADRDSESFYGSQLQHGGTAGH